MRSSLTSGAALAFGALAAVAMAGEVATFDTKVTISERAPAFHGKVRSDEAMCAEDRKVKLLRRTRRGRPTRLLGNDRSDDSGRWAITEPDEFTLKSGVYLARAPKAVVRAPLPTICAKDRSRKVVVD